MIPCAALVHRITADGPSHRQCRLQAVSWVDDAPLCMWHLGQWGAGVTVHLAEGRKQVAKGQRRMTIRREG